MKLDLANFGEVALLTVIENVNPENIPVMMAGIRKLKESSPGAAIILDLTLAQLEPAAIPTLKAVRSHPGYAQIGMKMVSTIPEVSDSPDLKSALNQFKVKIASKLFEWQKLNAEVINLRAKEKEATDKMGGKSLSEDLFQKLVAKNRALKKFSSIIGSQVDEQLKTLRGLKMDAKDFQETLNRFEAAKAPMAEVLKSKGLMP